MVTTLIAIWGAVLSTALAGVEFWRQRRRLKITVDYMVDNLGSQHVRVAVANAGRRPVTIDMPVFILDHHVDKDSHRMAFNTETSQHQYPLTLTEGQSAYELVSYQTLLGIASDFTEDRRVWGSVRDQLGNQYRSKSPLTLSPTKSS